MGSFIVNKRPLRACLLFWVWLDPVFDAALLRQGYEGLGMWSMEDCNALAYCSGLGLTQYSTRPSREAAR